MNDGFTTTWYGKDDLWAGLDRAHEGRWYAGPEPLKVQWQLPKGAELSVEGKRLDRTAPPLNVEFASGRGPSNIGDLQASFLRFPSEGCWEVTARIPNTELSFVVFVHPERENPNVNVSAPETDVWDTLRRPLDRPNVNASSGCPTSDKGTAARVEGNVFGSDPVTVQGFDETSNLPLDETTAMNDGRAFTLRFIVSPHYPSGPLLLRGYSLDGDGDVRFTQSEQQQEARLVVNEVSTPDWWVVALRDIHIPGTGCYALQIDGADFTQVIVFEVTSRE